MSLMDLLVALTWMSEESVSLRICQQQLPKLKSKEEKQTEERQQNIQEFMYNYKRCTRCIMGYQKEKKENI